MENLIHSYQAMLAQLETVFAYTGDQELGKELARAKTNLGEARKSFQQLAEAQGSVVRALDDASSVVDPGEDETRAYENELETAIALRNAFETAATLTLREGQIPA